MVISGANAGGKTVVLKTAGLLSLMALSGLHAPARAARVPFYGAVLADIGDRQSIAANLSTFTAHVANIRRMTEICAGTGGRALVLLWLRPSWRVPTRTRDRRLRWRPPGCSGPRL